MKDPIINFYELDKIKKYMPKIDDEQVKYTGMPLFKHILICGGTGSGKSNATMNYLRRTCELTQTYDHIFICMKTKGEPFYLFLEKALKDKVSFFTSVKDFPSISEFSDQIDDDDEEKTRGIKGTKKKKKQDLKQYLIIFDDCVNDKAKQDITKINDYFTFGRKKYITLLFLTQSYFDTSTFIRKQVSFVLLCSIRGARDLRLICKDFSSGIDGDELIQLYKNATQTPLNFFKICTMECPINKKFSKNFLDYYEIKSPTKEEEGTGCGTSKVAQEHQDKKEDHQEFKYQKNKLKSRLKRHVPIVPSTQLINILNPADTTPNVNNNILRII